MVLEDVVHPFFFPSLALSPLHIPTFDYLVEWLKAASLQDATGAVTSLHARVEHSLKSENLSVLVCGFYVLDKAQINSKSFLIGCICMLLCLPWLEEDSWPELLLHVTTHCSELILFKAYLYKEVPDDNQQTGFVELELGTTLKLEQSQENALICVWCFFQVLLICIMAVLFSAFQRWLVSAIFVSFPQHVVISNCWSIGSYFNSDMYSLIFLSSQ